MVLNEVDDVVVKLLHVCELRHEHVVASPKSFVVLRKCSDSVVVVAAAVVVVYTGNSSWGRVTPIGYYYLVRIMRRGNTESVIVEGKDRGNVESKLMMVVMVVHGLYLLMMLVMGFSSVNLAQQVLLSFLEELIRELPSIRHNLSKTIGVELANEAGEVVVFEIVGEKVPSELGGSPNDEGGVVFAPRDYVVGGRVVYKLVCFGKERCRN